MAAKKTTKKTNAAKTAENIAETTAAIADAIDSAVGDAPAQVEEKRDLVAKTTKGAEIYSTDAGRFVVVVSGEDMPETFETKTDALRAALAHAKENRSADLLAKRKRFQNVKRARTSIESAAKRLNEAVAKMRECIAEMDAAEREEYAMKNGDFLTETTADDLLAEILAENGIGVERAEG